MTTRTSNFVVLQVFVSCCLVFVFVKGQSACRTPDGAAGVCENVHQCNFILELIKKTQNVNSNALVQQIKQYECGRDVYAVKVCCPQSTHADTATAPPDVSSHRNIRLLPTDCGSSDSEDKVINGEKAALFEFPWMTLISYRTKNGLDFKCGGTVINDKYILTAAHCITKLKSTLTLAGVRVGEYDIRKEKDCQQYEKTSVCADPVQDFAIEESVPHPNFDQLTTVHDIGLIRVKGRINLAPENVKPVCLPINKAAREMNLKAVTVTGWGRTETASQSDILMKVVLDIVKPEVCQRFYDTVKRQLSHRQVCAARDGRDSCDGDSGGPLMSYSTDTGTIKHVQYGIVSFGPVPCAQKGNPAVYTNVLHYMDWILDTIRP